MLSELYKKDRYVATYDYLINQNIQEWDMSKANISILRQYNAISDDGYKTLYDMDKMKREIKIGYMMRDRKDISNIINNGFAEARKYFIESNGINDENILYIDKDSITVVGIDRPINGRNGYINFRMKNRYTSYYKIFGIDLLYCNNGSSDYFRLKNTNEQRMREKFYSADGSFLDLLLDLIYEAETRRKPDMVRMINLAYRKYTSCALAPTCYREFNQRSMFKLVQSSWSPYTYYSDAVPMDMRYVDISYNAEILRLFYKYYTREYFNSI